MNEEEKEAIETMKHWIEYEKENKDKINKANELIKIQETVLNLLEKKNALINTMQAEFERLENLEDNTDMLKLELEKKDKMIDEMAPQIYLTEKQREEMKEYIWTSNKPKDFKSFVKQYFERKVIPEEK